MARPSFGDAEDGHVLKCDGRGRPVHSTLRRIVLFLTCVSMLVGFIEVGIVCAVSRENRRRKEGEPELQSESRGSRAAHQRVVYS